jgi:pullulanase
MSAHDNNTLWDKLLLSNATSTEEERNAMNNLGAALIMISKGTPFWQAGEELLRTKGGDENSYKSDDSVNNLDWSVLREGSREYETMLYYKGLIEMRRAFSIFGDVNATVTLEELGSGLAVFTLDDGRGGIAKIVVNPHKTALPVPLPDGEWNLIADGQRAGCEVLARESGLVTVPVISVRIYVNDALIQ